MIDTWIIRILLFPLTIVYLIIIFIRNLLYDIGLLKSVSFGVPVISVGNLNTGGSGKTPMIEYLIRQLQPFISVGVLSRGYKRETKGYRVVQSQDLYTQSGDEPLLIKKKYPKTVVAVGEDRALGIPKMVQNFPELQLILLDDGYQHRSVTPYMHILLTDYNNLYTRDYPLPMGRLREPRSAAARANIIIVTKCPADLTRDQMTGIEKEIRPGKNQRLFFSTLAYHTAYNVFQTDERILLDGKSAFLLTGIANPEPLLDFLRKRKILFYHKKFADHHAFSKHDVAGMVDTFEKMDEPKKIFLTTEKDLVRLEPHFPFFLEKKINIYVLPIEVEFPGEQEDFIQLIKDQLIEFKV